jgi:hypothetical protein
MKHFLLILLLSSSTILVGQNLVPNPSFESNTNCPSILSFIHYATGWTRYNAETPDYYNACSTGNFAGVPNNYGGYQQASTGNAYAGIATYYVSIPNYRDIIGRDLTAPLSIGTKYYLSMQVNLSIDSFGSSSHASNNLGIRLSTVPYSNVDPAPINNVSHLNYSTVITDTMNWTRVSGSFIADSNYSYIAIGNFYTDANTSNVQVFSVAPDPFAYYFIDDVCVSQDSLTCYNVTGFKDQREQQVVNIYPNPTQGWMTVSLEEGTATSVTIRNSLGQLLLSDKTPSTNQVELDLSSYPTGIYFLQLEVDGQVITKKIIKE